MSLKTDGRGVWVHKRRGFRSRVSGDDKVSVERFLRPPEGGTLVLLEDGPDVPGLEEEGGKPSTLTEKRESVPDTGDVSVEGRGGHTVVVLVS